MKTPTMATRFSASLLGMTPSATLSSTAMPTAFWAGPNICTAWLAPLIVTLVISKAAGLQMAAQYGEEFEKSASDEFNQWKTIVSAERIIVEE